jgi:hypothetical protein
VEAGGRREGAAKARAFASLVPILAPGGVLFGSTILGMGVRQSLPAHALLRSYNRLGVFGNADDSLDDLTQALKAHFRTAAVRVVGCVAHFVGYA